MRACATKMNIKTHFVTCSNANCPGKSTCPRHETDFNLNRMYSCQLSLIFCLGEPKGNEQIVKVLKNNNLTSILIRGSKFFSRLWGSNSNAIDKLFKEILKFNPMPHDFLNQSSDPKYHLKEIRNMYMDKPLYKQFSDIFREEFGWKLVEEIEELEDDTEND